MNNLNFTFAKAEEIAPQVFRLRQPGTPSTKPAYKSRELELEALPNQETKPTYSPSKCHEDPPNVLEVLNSKPPDDSLISVLWGVIFLTSFKQKGTLQTNIKSHVQSM